MWKIGDVRVDGNVVLGPMSGYTSESYRSFMARFGTGLSVTEMVSAQGLIHNPSESERFVASDPGDLTCVQLFGGDPRSVSEGAAEAMRLNPCAEVFDINMGCPAGKVVRNGSGSALMSDPGRCGAIVKAVKRATGMPVTAKIRLGQDDGSINWRAVLDSLLDSDIDAVTIHTRTVEQRYSGKARHREMAGLGSEIPVPLIVSGDIFTVEDAQYAMETTGATAVMVARGGVGNPFLTTRINRFMNDGTVLPEPRVSQQVEWCLELLEATADELGGDIALARMRSIAPKFLSGCRYGREYRRAIVDRSTDLDGIRCVLERAADELGDLRMIRERRSPAPMENPI